jgi:hypothetical protein
MAALKSVYSVDVGWNTLSFIKELQFTEAVKHGITGTQSQGNSQNP